GSVLAQLANPDMRTPLAHALAWPERISAPVKKLNLAEVGSLQFSAPDTTRFPALALAQAALKAGGNAPCTLNAANEIAVLRFLKNEIGFLDIARIVGQTLEATPQAQLETIEAVLECDRIAREYAQKVQ